ncbi:MAG: hypothetical protein V4658_08700 [Bacteroidota bacterium]
MKSGFGHAVIAFVTFSLFITSTFAQNILPNGSFDEVTAVYHDIHNSGLDNVTEWKGINSVDFYKNRLGKQNYLGLTTGSLYPYEYAYVTLHSALVPHKKYRITLSIYSKTRKPPLSVLLINGADSNAITQFSIPELARSPANTFIPVFISRQRGWRSRWRYYLFEFQVRNEADIFIIGNCARVKTKIPYCFIDDIKIEEVDGSKEKTMRAQ